MDDKGRTHIAALIAIVLAAFITSALYILLVLMSFFVAMPLVMQSAVFLGTLLFVVFAASFVEAMRVLIKKFTL